ncbi:MAG: Ppx/GppA family phosphatase [Nitrospirae bacterium]|nr:MAG: Ppx/GppA family phosphatase [Nitrospirota bacterium]
MLLAGVDIGTLTCRLLIARVTGEYRLLEVYSDRRLLRLGEGVDRSRRLQTAAMERVLATLREWRAVIDRHGVDGAIAVGTSALRHAENRNEFLAAVKRESGFDVEIISGEEEARRTMLGIRSGLPLGVVAVLGLDIGGGSTEFILDRPGKPSVVRSIELGVVRLTERCLAHDPPTDEELAEARALVKSNSQTLRASLGDLQGATFVGTAGTITTLAAMAQQLPAYVGSRIHNYRLDLETICRLEKEILARTKAQRMDLLGLELGREDVIVAGTILLRGIMETLGLTVCLVSDLGLREGIVIDLAMRIRRV